MNQIEIVEQELKLSSILSLEMEVNGYSTKAFKVEALISHEMDAKLKYWLLKLSSKLLKERSTYEKLRNELIKKHGVEIEDPITKESKWNISLKIKDPDFVPDLTTNPYFDEKKDWPTIANPRRQAFIDEQFELMNQKVKITLPKFTVEELFCFKSKSIYANAGELLIQNESGKYSDIEYEDEINLKL